MTSGDVSQLIAALWSVGEHIRDPQYGNDVKGLRNVAHRHHLEKLASGRSLRRALLRRFLIAAVIVLPFTE